MSAELAFAIRDYTDLRLLQARCMRLPMMAEASQPVSATVVTIVSELGTNILKYAGSGYITLRRIEACGGIDIEVVAEDDGPGIASIELALQQNYSTGRTLGLGLPAVKRMADELSIDSMPGRGTRISAIKRIHGQPRHLRAAPPPVAVVAGTPAVLPCDIGECVRSLHGYEDGGDAAISITRGDSLLLAIVDATGHGEQARAVARRVRHLLEAEADIADLRACFESMHTDLRASVGVAAALLHVDLVSGMARYMGVGNTVALRVCGEHWRPLSRHGVVGQRLPTLYEQATVLRAGDVVLLWTDGIRESVLHERVRHLLDKSAHDIAQDLVRAAGRLHDDAGLLVLKWGGS